MRNFEELGFESLNIRHASRDGNDESAFSITYTEKHGKRVTFSPEVHEAIGKPPKVQVALNGDGIVIGECLPNQSSLFKLCESGRRSVIYSAELAKTIVDRFQLDFSSRTSISFYECEYISVGDKKAAFIVLRNNEDVESP